MCEGEHKAVNVFETKMRALIIYTYLFTSITCKFKKCVGDFTAIFSRCKAINYNWHNMFLDFQLHQHLSVKIPN